MATEIGDLTSSGTIQQTRRTYRSNGTKTVEYVLNTADESTFLAGYSVGTSTSDGLILESISLSKFKGVSRATLNYVTAEELVAKYVTGVTQSSDSNASEEPIETHPDYSTAWETSKPGVTSFLLPSPTYTRTEVQNSFSFSQSNIVDDVGTIDTPTGLTGAESGKWLKTSKTVSQQGDKFAITETWQYNKNGWDTDIYTA